MILSPMRMSERAMSSDETVLFAMSDLRHSFRERIENGRSATAGQLFKSCAAGEHQDDHDADEILAE